MPGVNTKTITIARRRGYFAAARAVKLQVDGKPIGTIRQGETLSFDVPADAEEIVGSVDWGKTNRFALKELGDGASLVLKAWFTFNPFRNFGIPTLPMKIELADPQAEAFS